MSDHIRSRHESMETVWLIGTGNMGVEYARVLQGLGAPFEAIGRSPAGVERFFGITQVHGIHGGIEAALRQNRAVPQKAIVAVPVGDLTEVTAQLLNAGVKEILVEKPGGTSRETLGDLARLAEKMRSEIFIAYNRRYYASVLHAESMIRDDGGITSFQFEFTEWSHVIEKLETPAEIKEIWLLANSSHVIDLAFFCGGKPLELACFHAGSLSWHKSGSRFVGAGSTVNGALFSYAANWDSAGRWGVELLTQKGRYILRPLEQLQFQKKGSIEIQSLKIEDHLDKQFKPGLFLMAKDFLFRKSGRLCTIQQQIDTMKFLEKFTADQ